MCLISLAYHSHPQYSLLLAANRDEYYHRPTRAAQFWEESPGLLAGRDLEAGGTWMGVTKDGRLAAVTNHRNPPTTPENPHSRGMLTLDFLTGTRGAKEYLLDLDRRSGHYAGFNLLLMDSAGLYYYSNIERRVRALPAGIFSVSNGLLDSDWPKQRAASAALGELLDGAPSHADLQATVTDRHYAVEGELPDTGIDHEMELALSARFIVTEEYGTRATTTLAIGHDGQVDFLEQNYRAGGLVDGQRRHAFRLSNAS